MKKDIKPIVNASNFFINLSQIKPIFFDKKCRYKLAKKSIYKHTWAGFYSELQLYSFNELTNHYGYSYKKQLMIAFARSDHYLEKVSLDEFKCTKKEILQQRFEGRFNNKIERNPNFKTQLPKLSTIHHFMYQNSLHFAVVRLGFTTKQNFINFFAKTNLMEFFSIQTLKESISVLQGFSCKKLKQKLGLFYEQPLVLNKKFKNFNYSLKELHFMLATEGNLSLVVARLGGHSKHAVNNKLSLLNPFINLTLEDLQRKPLVALTENNDQNAYLWTTKLYQLFAEAKSNRYPLQMDPELVPQLDSPMCLEELQPPVNTNSELTPPLWRPYLN